MPRTILLTTPRGMFGGATLPYLLAEPDVTVRALLRSADGFDDSAPGVEVCLADLDDPATLPAALEGVTDVFLVTPMGPRVAVREQAVIAAAVAAGGPRIVKLHGAVRHGADPLARQHEAVLETLRASGLPTTLVSPNSVMETSLLGLAEPLRLGSLVGTSGTGRVGFVALDDVARAAAVVLAGDGHDGRTYELTGPAALDMAAVAATFGEVLGRRVTYVDVSEHDLAAMIREQDPAVTDEELEVSVLCHLRAWRDGGADLVTDTVTALTGRPATSLRAWIEAHREVFDAAPRVRDRVEGFLLRHRYAH